MFKKTLLSCVLCAALSSSLFAAEIRILPIDKAKFLAGANFDFLVEFKDIQVDPKNVQVSINGKKAEQFFNKTPKISSENGIVSYRIDEVSFPKSGNFKVLAKANSEQREVNYKVVTTSKNTKVAKNVILFIGDGMSLQAKQMGRILSKGITEGKYDGLLEMEKLENIALVTTSGYDSLTTDSANSASAYATGHKSVVNAMGVYEDSTKDPFDDPKVENVSEILKRTKNMSIGLVTTANITDATPAAMFTHTRRRSEQNSIAADMLRIQPEVILGAGLRHFIPQSEEGSKRKDDRNLIDEYKKVGYSVSFNKKELETQAKQSSKLLGLYNMDNMNVYLDREVLKNPKVLGKFDQEPNLMQMTKTAIDVLSKNKNGFFLMVEGASIDKQLHKMDWQRATYDTIELDQAVKIAKDFADKNKDTLIIVVADHAHGASITGTYHQKDGKTGREAVRTYANAVFPTFEDKNKDGFPDNPDADITLAVQYANHPDYKAHYTLQQEPINPTVVDSQGRNVANPKIQGEEYTGNIPYDEDQEVHAADDVVLMADGVGSRYFRGVMDNTEVFFGIMQALGVKATK